MLNYTTQSFYPDLVSENEVEMVTGLYREIMTRTAKLVAKWQTVRMKIMIHEQ